MDRRRFARFVALGCAISPLASLAQRAAKIPRICVLAVPSFDSPEMHALLDAVRQGLRENGYVEGKNIVVEYRSAGGKFEQLPRLASEVVGLDINVIVVGTGSQIMGTLRSSA